MRKLVTSVAVAAVLLVPQLNLTAQSDEALAVMVPGGGSYSRPITTDSAEAQAFFDQGLAWLGVSTSSSQLPPIRKLRAWIQTVLCPILA